MAREGDVARVLLAHASLRYDATHGAFLSVPRCRRDNFAVALHSVDRKSHGAARTGERIREDRTARSLDGGHTRRGISDNAPVRGRARRYRFPSDREA